MGCDQTGGCDPQPSGNPHWARCSKCGAEDFPVSEYAAHGTRTESGPLVANRHWFKGKKLPPRAVYIGRRTPLGNPFTVQEHGMGALAKYRAWLWDKIKTRDRAVMSAMTELRPDHVLICSCKPRPCHGDVVQKAWIYMRDQGLLGDLFLPHPNEGPP